MKTIPLLGSAIALAATIGWAPAMERPKFTLDTSPLNQYVWRGMLVNNRPVLQNSLTVAYRNAHVNIFTNHDLDNVNGRKAQVNELDFDLGYDYSREDATVSAGVVRYTFPHTGASSTTEIYGGIGFNGQLHPSVRAYVDVDSIMGTYVTFDAFRAVALPRFSSGVTWSAVLAGGLGCGSANHNGAYYGVKRSAVADVHPSLSLPISFRNWQFTPKMGHAVLLDPTLRREAVGKVRGVYMGFSLTWTL